MLSTIPSINPSVNSAFLVVNLAHEQDGVSDSRSKIALVPPGFGPIRVESNPKWMEKEMAVM